MDYVWMRDRDGGEPQMVEATPQVIVPLLVRGWRQVDAPSPETDQEEEE